MIKIVISIILTVLAAGLYRAGGMSKDWAANPKWIPKWLRNTKARDLGVPLCAIITLVVFGYYHWILLLVFALMFGAMTTYNKWAKKEWLSWLITGLFYAISVFPIVIVYGLWWGLLYRVLACSLLITAWSLLIGNDVLEESGRGFINNSTLAFLLIK